MKRYVKGALIFTGGVTTGLAVGAVGVAALIVKHKEYAAHCIGDAVYRWLHTECDYRKEARTDVN